MRNTTRLTLATITLLAGVAAAAAQTPQDQTAHHPDPASPAAAPGGAMPPMNMGNMMRRMMGGGEGMAMMPGQHIEGRVAFLKAELGITDVQMPQWNAYADTLRANGRGMQGMMAKMMQAGMPTTAPARADAMMQMMTAHLEAMKPMVSAGKALYAVLSDAQKKMADELMAGPMGRM